jgi:holo-[acyl-carrier protein] synthase
VRSDVCSGGSVPPRAVIVARGAERPEKCAIGSPGDDHRPWGDGAVRLGGVIVGIGIDVVDVERFNRQLERTPRLLERLFTEPEQALAPASLAARFAAKEAVAKALGAPVGLRWTDVTVHRADDGRPTLEITGTVQDRADRLGVTRMHVSLSHDAGIASAVVIAEGTS